MLDYNRSNTIEDILRRYDLDGFKRDRNRIYQIQGELTNTNGILEDFVDKTTENIELITDQLDGNVTSWFYNYVPTLSNVPASSWNTDELKKEHLEDLFYNTDTGKVYKFIYNEDTSTYLWLEVTNIVGAQTLAVANAAQDVSDHNRRVFVVQPIPPYDVGDVWANNTNHKLYRCKIAKTTGQQFESSDWIDSLNYSEAIAVENTMITSYATKSELTRSADSIKASVKAVQVSTNANNTIWQTEPTVPYLEGDIYIKTVGTTQEVYNCINSRSTGTYDPTDWELDLDLTDYVSEAGIEVFADSINYYVKNGNNLASAINQSATTIKLNANKLDFNSYTFNLTTDNIKINSNKFKVSSSGELECSDIKITGGDIELFPDILYKNTYFTITPEDHYSSGVQAKSVHDGLTQQFGYIINDDFSCTCSVGQMYTGSTNKYEGYINVHGNPYTNSFDDQDYRGLASVQGHNGIIEARYLLPNNDVNRIILKPLGNGDTYPALEVYKNGAGTSITNNGVWANGFYPNSLEELKKDFEKLPSGLDIIKAIDIYKYRYKDEEDTKKHIGLVIGKDYKYSEEVLSDDNNSVDLYSFVGVCCKAIQEQQEQIEELKKQIENLNRKDDDK